MEGSYASSNPMRFSTKFHEEEQGQYYFGHRFFVPVLGRWLSFDPAEEEDGSSLYHFVRNDPLSGIDALGLRTLHFHVGFDKSINLREVTTAINVYMSGLRESISECDPSCGGEEITLQYDIQREQFNNPPRSTYSRNNYEELGKVWDALRTEGRIPVLITTLSIGMTGRGPALGRAEKDKGIAARIGATFPGHPWADQVPLPESLSGLGFSHEMGHYVGWQDDITRSTHSTTEANLMFDSKRPTGKPDPQWCAKVYATAK